MSWREAWNLTGILANDSSSQVGGAMAGWDSPKSAEWLLLADLYDLQHTSKAKRKPNPYPRPKPKKAPSKQLGKTQMPMADAIKLLQSVSPTRTTGPVRDSRGRFAKRPA